MKKKKLPIHFAAWTSEFSWRATVAPAGWASSGLRAPHTGGGAGGPDGTCRGHWLTPLLKKTRFVHVILAPVHAILLCVAPSENSSKLCSSSLRRGRASPHRVVIVRDLQPFNHSRFVHGRQASILVLESLRSRRAECHLRSRVIPADDSHALPFFEEILESSQTQGNLRLNLAHRHPISTIFSSQLTCGIKDDVQV